MKFHDTLSEKIFNGEELKPEVKEKLNEIADAFIEFLEVPTDAIKDVVLTGSMMSYNYTKYSDIDLHLLVDFEKVHEDCPIVGPYLISKKSEFNKNHDIFIYGIPVEVYAESIDNDNVHNGLYSLKQDKWIDFPKKIEPTDNDAAVEAKFNEFKDLAEICDDSEVAIEIIDKIKKMRKAGLAEGGEFSTENLTFKKLRDEGIIGKLMKIKKQGIDKQLSLESYNESVTLDIYTKEGDWVDSIPCKNQSNAKKEFKDYKARLNNPNNLIYKIVKNESITEVFKPLSKLQTLADYLKSIRPSLKLDFLMENQLGITFENDAKIVVTLVNNKFRIEGNTIAKTVELPTSETKNTPFLHMVVREIMNQAMEVVAKDVDESIKEELSVSDYLKSLKDNGTLTDMEGAEYLVQSFNDGKLEVIAGYKDIEKAAKRFLDICGKYDKAVFEQLFDNGKDIKILDSDHKELNEMPKYLSYVNESTKDIIKDIFKEHPYWSEETAKQISDELDKLPKGTKFEYRLDNSWHECVEYYVKTDINKTFNDTKANWSYIYTVDGEEIRRKPLTSFEVALKLKENGKDVIDKLVITDDIAEDYASLYDKVDSANNDLKELVNDLPQFFEEDYKDGIYKISTIGKALQMEKEFLDSVETVDGQADSIMSFIIPDGETIEKTILTKRDKIKDYKPQENEYYLDMVRDTGWWTTDYNLAPMQKLVNRWNGITENYELERIIKLALGE